MDPKDKCQSLTLKHAYDDFRHNETLGLEGLYQQTTFDAKLIRKEGYIVNKSDVQVWDAFNTNDLTQRVYTEIRHIEEMLFGMFKCTNPEFQLINNIFLKNALMGEVYVVYSEELKNFELEVLKAYCEENEEDPMLRLNKAMPESNFRLFRRNRTQEKGYCWESILTELREINIDPYLGDILPVRCTFNDGRLFRDLHEIFKETCSMEQAYIRLFLVINKCIEISARGVEGLKKRARELLSVSPILTSDDSNLKNKPRSKLIELIDKTPHLTEYYDNCENYRNDSLNRLGFGGDDSTKCERITTGENFRAMQPSIDMQHAMEFFLNNMGKLIKDRYGQDVQFENSVLPNQQGIPIDPNKKNFKNKDDFAK